MKKLLVVSAIAALGLTSAVFAGGLPEEMPAAPAAVSSSDTGVYVGIAGGYGMTHWKNIDGAVTPDGTFSVSKDNGAVGRAFLGFDLNRYFAAEFGYTYFFNQPKIAFNDATEVTTEKMKRTHALDLMGKIKAPVVENFDLYAKIGVNYLMTKPEGSDAINNINLAYGAGADYYITPNIIANVEWLRFNGNEKIKEMTKSKHQPHTDAFMVGLRYKFDI